jgi:hypothetical protein
MPLAAVEALIAQYKSWFFILAHPGHELRAHYLFELTGPIAAILTDGSGSTGQPRLEETRQLLACLGARPGVVFGAMTDGDVYRALMQNDSQLFQRIVDRLAAEIDASETDAVVLDAAEGFNPVHDLCHWIGRAALARVSRPARRIQAFELDLVGHPDQSGPGLRVVLDAAAFARKIGAAKRYRAIAADTAAAFDAFGVDAFRVEFLRALPDVALPPATWVPTYEQIGEQRVATGRYSSVLRFATHVRPVMAALAPHADGGPCARIAAETLRL